MRTKFVGLLVVAWALAGVVGPGAALSGNGPPAPMRTHGRGHWYERVCTKPSTKHASCQAQVVSNASGVPLVGATPATSSYGPAQFHTAYNLPTVTPSGQPTQTIAIVDAYDDPSAESDLAVYDAQFGLPACTTANGCFKKVNQTGGTSYPPADSGWSLEVALDVETAHEICQNCKILLVEATSSSMQNLGMAENEAANLGANVISNSWSGGDSSSDSSYDTSYFKHPGVAETFATGDGGYGVGYPASSQYVTAVGGTTLHVTGSNAWSSETVWSGAGSGCSSYETKPAWQHDTGCAGRTVADVSADADPNTGAAVYETVGGGGWYQVGGTSLATPLIAAVYALADNSSVNYGSTPYGDPSALHDITSGSNGACGGSYLCTGVTGYDGPTGLGTPNGLGAFTSGPPVPNFSLAASPSSQTVAQGGGTSYGVTLTPANGYSSTATLSVSGLPAGAGDSFTPTAVTSGAPSSTLAVTTSSTTPAGTYTLTISGYDGTLTRTTTATLVVQPPPPALAASPASVSPSGSVTASWSNVASPTTTDWIAVATSGSANTSYLSWVYDSSCTTSAGASAKASGTCSVKMPSSGGSYVLRLFAANGYTLLATSNTVTVTVTKANPTLSTSASASVGLGGTIKDTATLAGGSSPTGTITFRLFGPSDPTCASTALATSTAAVSANGSYSSASYPPTQTGTYHWIASYAGDGNNNSAGGACGDSGESVIVTNAVPTMTTQASGGVALGGLVSDTATLAGGSSPTGTITFNLYGPGDTSCSHGSVFTSTVAVTGNGQYASASFKPLSSGTYFWVASYSGNSTNNPVTGTCGTTGESVTVGAAGPAVTVSATSAPKGTTVTVSWSGVASPTTTDWLGVYAPGAANTAYLSWIYDSSCTTTAAGTAKASGSCVFTLPATAGTYQFRLLANNGYTLLATSPSISVS